MNKKSPIKAKTLRHYGQSLDERIDSLVNDKALLYVMYSICFIMLTAKEWIDYYYHISPSPKTMTFTATIVFAFSFYKIRKILREVKNLRQGREGERAVGQYLETFREKGWKIFHDLVGEGFNVDHVIICDKGIFLIETKTFSKREGRKPTIQYDGQGLVIDGFDDKDRILNQVKAASTWLKNLILETTGQVHPVRPVVVFPGWFIEQNKHTCGGDVWVLNPKALPVYIENQKTALSVDQVNLVSFHLSRYVRSKEAELAK